jgi:membrane fusion protein (multidrug efflux system)
LKAKIRLDRVSNDYNRYNNLYKSHTITKQQYRSRLLEAENQVRILQQQEKKQLLFKIVVAKSKQLTSKLMCGCQYQRAALLDSAI